MRYIGIVVLTVILSLEGCAHPAAVGAAAAALGIGYYVGQDSRNTGRIIRDTNISAEINTAYFRAPDIDPLRIDIYTYNGVVTLSGKVPSQGVAQRAVQIAQCTRGVTQVISELQIVPPNS